MKLFIQQLTYGHPFSLEEPMFSYGLLKTVDFDDLNNAFLRSTRYNTFGKEYGLSTVGIIVRKSQTLTK